MRNLRNLVVGLFLAACGSSEPAIVAANTSCAATCVLEDGTVDTETSTAVRCVQEDIDPNAAAQEMANTCVQALMDGGGCYDGSNCVCQLVLTENECQ